METLSETVSVRAREREQSVDGRSWKEGKKKKQQMERRAKTLKRCVTPDDNVVFSSWMGQDATASVLKLKAQIFLTGERGACRSLAVKKRKKDLNMSKISPLDG